MAFVAVLLLMGSVWMHQVTANCNKTVVDQIKALNVDKLTLDEIVGDWKLVYAEVGESTETFAPKCDKISFKKDGETYKADFGTKDGGVKEINEKDGVFVHIGDAQEPDMTYYTVHKSPDTVAFYVCSADKDSREAEISMVLVRGTTDFTENLKVAKEIFKSFGLPVGMESETCPDSEQISSHNS